MSTPALLERTLASLAPWSGRAVVVAMSGGVDSALAAALLHRAGAHVIGVHMRTWHYNDCGEREGLATCCSPADARDARRVADLFGFPFYAMDFQGGFRASVIEPFIADYLAGRTPNPCVHCNNQLKLGSLLAKGKAYGAEAVATGHYGRLADNPATGRRELRVAADAAKDQTYYLFGLAQPQLRGMLMPLGDLTKPQVRQLAAELGLHLADKPDSQDICFVTDNNYRRFLREEAGLDESQLAGAIVSTRGEVLGRHDGIHNYTIGQRKGLGIAAPRPLYVVDLDPDSRTVIVGHDEDVLASAMRIDGINWVGRAPSPEPFRASVKIRYRSPGYPATVYPEASDSRPVDERIRASAPSLQGTQPSPGSVAQPLTGSVAQPPSAVMDSPLDRGNHSDDEKLTAARVVFDASVRAIAPGQAAVAYDEAAGASVLLGGWIRRRLSE
jgi:tRNA-specific 2-thiouridylase